MPLHNIIDDAEMADVNARFTQAPVEVAAQVTGADLIRRFTQAPVEVAAQVTGADLIRRFTQIVIEVPITQPVHPFGDQPMPEHPPWSPSFIQDPLEGKEQAYASFYGSHNKEIVIGERRNWTKFTRR